MTIINKSILAGAVLALSATSAMAGGYSRGSADLSPLLGDSTSFSGGVTYVSPTRRITAVNGVATTGGARADYAESYFVPSAVASAKLAGNLRCAGSYAQPYGADAEYGTAEILAGVSSTTGNSLATNEFGLTCSYGFDAGPVDVYLIGGGFLQTINYTEKRGTIIGGAFVDNVADLDVSDNSFGYRIGVGVAKPEIALKASLIYRSKVDHTVRGIQTLGAIGAAGAAASPLNVAGFTAAQFAGNYGVFANANTPASVKLSLQSGVAAGTLVFGSLEWTDWSTIQQDRVIGDGTGTAAVAAVFNGIQSPGGPTIDAFFRDGWTANIGVAHQFTDSLSVLASYTWDRGTSTGRSDNSTTHTIGAGVNYKFDEKASLRAGLAYTAIGASTYTTTGLTGAALTVTNGASSAIAGGLNISAKF